MRVLVMGDIHGAHRALVQCLERSGFDREQDMLIQLGDVTDSFAEVYDCVETLLQIKNLIAIKGNHDDWFTEFIRTGYHPADWTAGGTGTAKSYLRLTGREKLVKKTMSGFKTALDSQDIPPAHREFFERQQLFYIDAENNCFVHAGFNRHLPFSRQKPEVFFWDRDLWSSALAVHTRHKPGNEGKPFYKGTAFHEVFIGHTPTLNWNTDKPMHALNIWNLDTGAGHTGRLTVMDIRTKEYWQSDPVTELYAENDRMLNPAEAINTWPGKPKGTMDP